MTTRVWIDNSGTPISAANLNGIEFDITAAQTAANAALTTANAAATKNTTQDGRLTTIETLGGLAPGDVSDATIKNIILNQSSNTSVELANQYVKWIAGHIGIQKSNPVNAFIYVGSGTGTLTDAATSGQSSMGLKIKIDSPTNGLGRTPDGIQSNVNMLDGAIDGSVRSLMGRVDFNDTGANVGDAVGVWGDAWITAASGRNAWGGNIYATIRPGVAYAKTAVGLEVGFENQGTLDNGGGGLHVVSHGTGKKGAFGLKISSDATWGSAGTFRTHLLMDTNVAPSENYVWIGPATANLPTGTPKFQIDVNGNVGIGIAAPTSSVELVAIGGPLRIGATGQAVKLIPGSGSPEGVVTASIGALYFNVAGGASTTLYVKTSGTGNTGWTASDPAFHCRRTADRPAASPGG